MAEPLARITLEAADNRLPPPREYLSITNWLAALPPDAVILVGLSDGVCIPTPARHVIEGLRVAPSIRAMFDAAME